MRRFIISALVGITAGLITIGGLAYTASSPDEEDAVRAAVTSPVRMAAAGDICGSNCKATSDLIINRGAGLVLTLGDNAYDSGTLNEYNTKYDPTWGRFKGKTKPSAGNHDWETPNAQGYRDYFGISGPLYGSFNRKTWHFVRLDTEQLSSSVQENWMQSDLNADSHACEIVYGHHPPFSSGTVHGSTSELTNAWNIAKNAGVEIWLAGHEHNYERVQRDGILELVVGTGGTTNFYGFGSPVTGSQKRIANTNGVLFMSLKASSYTYRFRNTNGVLLDSGSGACG